MNLLRVSMSPHVYGDESIKKLMYGVIIALLPALGVSLFFFGIGALIVTATAIASALLFEFLIAKYILKQQPSLWDGSAVLTGLLLAFNVPTNLPLWIIIIGSFVAIAIGKMSFGGLGNNPFNPALVGRVFLLISFPVPMTSWPEPITSRLQYADAVTGATPLGLLQEGVKNGTPVEQIMTNPEMPTKMEMLYGGIGGSLGEMAAIALLLGMVYMLVRKIITWHIPVSIIATLFVFTGMFWLIDPSRYADPVFHLLTGGALLGAIYMATDYVTSPMSKRGMLVYGFGIGLLTFVIRTYGAYPEGISFAILLMNAFVPLINRYIKPKRFGEVQKST